MTIKTSTFGRLQLTGQDATRFIQHIVEDKPSRYTLAAIGRAKEVSERIKKGEKFTFLLPNKS